MTNSLGEKKNGWRGGTGPKRWAKSIAMWDDDAPGQWTMSMDSDWDGDESPCIWGWHTSAGRRNKQIIKQTNRVNSPKKKNPGAGPRISRPENAVKITKATVTPHKNRQKKRSQGVKLGCQCCLHLGGNKVAFIGLTTEHKSQTNAGAIIMNEFSVLPLLWALFATNVFKPWTWKVWKLILNI